MNKASFYLFCLATLSASQANGEANSKTSFSIQPLLHRFDYTELDIPSRGGKVLDRETGWIPGISLQVKTKFWDWMDASFASTLISGTVVYNGQTQPPLSIPLTTNTDTKITSHGVRLAVPILSRSELFGSTKYYQWDRNILGASGFFEKYTWWELSVGVKSKIWYKDNQTLHLEIGLLRIKQPEIFIDLTKFNWGSTTLQIGEEYGGRFQLEYNLPILKYPPPIKNAWLLGINAYIEIWNFGRSNTRQTTGGAPNVFATEPRSETRNIGLQLSLKHLF